MKCCNEQDYCNKDLHPTLPPPGKTHPHWHFLIFFAHNEILPRFKARAALPTGSFMPHCAVMRSDSLNCYKPQCGAGAEWHMRLRQAGAGGGRGRWYTACRLGLFSHPLMKRTASPQGLLEFLASGRMWDICPSVTPCNKPPHTHSLFACHTRTVMFREASHTHFLWLSSKIC